MTPTQLAIPIAGIAMPLVLVPIAMAMRLRQRKREWEHLERMKAMELGMPAPAAAQGGGVVAMGAGVPVATFLAAMVTTVILVSDFPGNRLTHHGGLFASEPELIIPTLGIIWGTAFTVSAIALIIALFLGVIQARAQNKASQSNVWANAHAKPAFDADAYEFAGHRG